MLSKGVCAFFRVIRYYTQLELKDAQWIYMFCLFSFTSMEVKIYFIESVFTPMEAKLYFHEKLFLVSCKLIES